MIVKSILQLSATDGMTGYVDVRKGVREDFSPENLFFSNVHFLLFTHNTHTRTHTLTRTKYRNGIKIFYLSCIVFLSVSARNLVSPITSLLYS